MIWAVEWKRLFLLYRDIQIDRQKDRQEQTETERGQSQRHRHTDRQIADRKIIPMV